MATPRPTGRCWRCWLLLPVGLWASADLAVTLPRAYAFIAAAALYWTVAAQGGRPWLLRYTGWALLLAGLAMALAVIAATPLAGSAILSPLAQAIRAPLPFLQPERFNPNLSGQLLAILLAPAAAYALIGERAAPGGRLLRLAAAVLSLLLAALLLLTQSRGALLGLAVALPVMTTLANRRWLWVWGPLGLAGSVAIVILQPSLSSTLLAGGDALSSAQGRVELWSRALYLMQDFPFTGVGLGMPERVINLLYPSVHGRARQPMAARPQHLLADRQRDGHPWPDRVPGPAAGRGRGAAPDGPAWQGR
ncbi:MAG: O-antigen ligase family protein [Anaerolineae bacterium]